MHFLRLTRKRASLFGFMRIHCECSFLRPGRSCFLAGTAEGAARRCLLCFSTAARCWRFLFLSSRMPDSALRWQQMPAANRLEEREVAQREPEHRSARKKITEVPVTTRNVYRASKGNPLKKSVLADSSYGTFDHAVWALMVRSLCGVEAVRARVCVYRQLPPFVHSA